MARNKAKDDEFFNCSQESEHNYVAGLYSIERIPSVCTLLTNGFENGSIHYSTHFKVYTLIKENLRYPMTD